MLLKRACKMAAIFACVAAGAGCHKAVASTEAPVRTPLDRSWEEHMLDGRAGIIAIEGSQTRRSDNPSIESFERARGQPEEAVWTNRGISVARFGEGFWGNGGWRLEGGLLARAVDGPSSFELYGKAVVRQFSYFPFPFHREIPHETGYEFFLVHRLSSAPQATIVRKWVFPPNEVVVKSVSHGGTREDVQAVLQYDAGTRTATVRITGLRRPYEERVDLSSVRDSATR